MWNLQRLYVELQFLYQSYTICIFPCGCYVSELVLFQYTLLILTFRKVLATVSLLVLLTNTILHWLQNTKKYYSIHQLNTKYLLFTTNFVLLYLSFSWFNWYYESYNSPYCKVTLILNCSSIAYIFNWWGTTSGTSWYYNI